MEAASSTATTPRMAGQILIMATTENVKDLNSISEDTWLPLLVLTSKHHQVLYPKQT